MATFVRIPRNWPDADEMEDELDIPGLNRRRMEVTQYQTSTPYLPYTHARQDISVPRSIPVRESTPQNLSELPFPTSSTTPDELFIPGFDQPARRRIRARRRQSPPVVPIVEEQPTPHLSIRVDNLTMQTTGPRVPPSIRPGTPSYWQDHVLIPQIPPSTTQRSRQFISSPSMQDELFFEDPPSLSISSLRIDRESGPFQPVIRAEPEDLLWRRYEAPMELLRPRSGTSVIIESILEPSINRIKARHQAEEDEESEAAIAQLKRESNAESVREAQLSTEGGQEMDPHLAPTRIPQRAISPADDSGYGSTSHEMREASSPSSSSSYRRSFGGLSSLFRREKEVEKLPKHCASIFTLPLFPQSPIIQETDYVDSATSTNTTECVSCLDNFSATKMVKLSCHSYCGDCFIRLVKNSLESEAQWPAKCCLNTIPPDMIITHVDGPTKKKFRQRNAEWSVPISDRIYCPRPTCCEWIPPKNVNNENQSAKCAKCNFKVCRMCRGPFHGSSECPSDNSIQATYALAELEGWKICFSCNALVEHNKGCRHMTCRCKAQFCYICGLRWRTCLCTEEDLARVQQQVDLRRADRRSGEARQHREARFAEEEKRVILAEVEAFIRQEAEQQARIAEQQRVAAEAARRQREATRISSINLRYRAFRNELEDLHNVQKIPIAERHEFSGEVLKRDRQNALNVLSLRHPAEIEVLREESSTKLIAATTQFSTEYESRLAAERRIEETYILEMTSFWASKPEGEDKVRNARETLRKNQTSHYIFWESHQKEKFQIIQMAEAKKKETLAARHRKEVKAVDEKAGKDELAWERRCWAEKKWVEAIVRERVAMLHELEQHEYAMGEDVM